MIEQILIVGPNDLQNALLASWLPAEIKGVRVDYSPDINLRRFVRGLVEGLILWDCLGIGSGRLLHVFGKIAANENRIPFAAFNLSSDLLTERVLRKGLDAGIMGIFFDDDEPKVIARGIRLILEGQRWIPRDSLAGCVLGKIGDPRSGEADNAPLTRREIEILLSVSTGATNDDIAGKLKISTNTVKTHLYNIFHKIDVSNRLQAALWAAKNLPYPRQLGAKAVRFGSPDKLHSR